eukprot:363544-Chlamydomonas_euryale.AAC.8
MSRTWAVHGPYMGRTWAVHGRYMGGTWAVHKQYMSSAWAVHGQQPVQRASQGSVPGPPCLPRQIPSGLNSPRPTTGWPYHPWLVCSPQATTTSKFGSSLSTSVPQQCSTTCTQPGTAHAHARARHAGHALTHMHGRGMQLMRSHIVADINNTRRQNGTRVHLDRSVQPPGRVN